LLLLELVKRKFSTKVTKIVNNYKKRAFFFRVAFFGFSIKAADNVISCDPELGNNEGVKS